MPVTMLRHRKINENKMDLCHESNLENTNNTVSHHFGHQENNPTGRWGLASRSTTRTVFFAYFIFYFYGLYWIIP